MITGIDHGKVLLRIQTATILTKPITTPGVKRKTLSLFCPRPLPADSTYPHTLMLMNPALLSIAYTISTAHDRNSKALTFASAALDLVLSPSFTAPVYFRNGIVLAITSIITGNADM